MNTKAGVKISVSWYEDVILSYIGICVNIFKSQRMTARTAMNAI